MNARKAENCSCVRQKEMGPEGSKKYFRARGTSERMHGARPNQSFEKLYGGQNCKV